MFSALSLGSSIYILDKTSSPKFVVGEVVGVTQPKYGYNNLATVDLRVKIEDSIYLLDKTSSPKYLIGEVVGVTQPKYSYNNLATVDLRVKIEDSILEFNNLPSINSINTYNGGKLIISETKQGILNEVETLLANSKNIVENINTYKKNIKECEDILKLINPQFAKDKERDDRLLNLETRFDGVESKLDKIFNIINK